MGRWYHGIPEHHCLEALKPWLELISKYYRMLSQYNCEGMFLCILESKRSYRHWRGIKWHQTRVCEGYHLNHPENFIQHFSIEKWEENREPPAKKNNEHLKIWNTWIPACVGTHCISDTHLSSPCYKWRNWGRPGDEPLPVTVPQDLMTMAELTWKKEK